MSKNPGKWVEVGYDRRPNGAVRTRYRAVIFDGEKRVRKWFNTREEARRWIENTSGRKMRSNDLRKDWRFVYGVRAEDVYERERRFS